MSLYETLKDKLDGKQYYNYFAAFCPYEEHKTPALLVFEDGMFKCLSCNKIGTHEKLANFLKVRGVPMRTRSQPSRILPRWKNWEREYGDLNGIVGHAHAALKRYPKKWFVERKINEFTEQGTFGFLDGWAVFPVFGSDHVIRDVVVRAIRGKGSTRYVVAPITDFDGDRFLYVPNWQRVTDAKTVYVVFGMIDAWALESLELPVVTGITGKTVPVSRLQELHKKFIIIPDQGEEEDAHKIANAYGMGARVKTLRYDFSCKDPDEIRIKYGNNHLLKLIGA